MSSADRRSGAFCAGTENAPLRVADSANARQREKKRSVFTRHCEEMPDTCVERTTCHGKRKKREAETEAALHGAAFIWENGRGSSCDDAGGGSTIWRLNGIRSERKTVYTDMEELEDFGLDIIRVKERPGGYYLASRKFELAELKLLVDAVQASKFITTKKSRELIAKLETLCGREQAKQLHRQVVVTNRSKAVNENIYYNVDMIYNAIAENVKIRFQYFEWTVNKEMKLRRDGSYYEVSPWLLSWDDENYYLIAYDDRSRDIRHYRVDKMLKIELTAESREGKEQFRNFDVAAYSRKTFGMFAGRTRL